MTGIITIPFHIGDFLSGTLYMDTLEKGAYLMLLLAHYQKGHQGIPNDDKKLSRIAGVNMKVWKRIKPIMQEKFTVTDDFWIHSTCVDVIQKVHDKSSAQRAKALKKHGSGYAAAKLRHCQPKPKPKEDTNVSSNPIPLFDFWWEKYPHKVGKGDAKKKYEIAARKAPHEILMAGLQAYIENKPPDRPWCNPSTWLHQERWLDKPAKLTKGAEQKDYSDMLLDVYEKVSRDFDEREGCAKN